MCGIAGWFTPVACSESESLPVLRRMVGAIAHRGPDGHGYKCHPHAALGHARLAIIDLDGGRQPFQDDARGMSLVFNGEIYNYQRLRHELARRGCHFLTHSDTEVILRLYQQEGIAGFERLRGMYAFALWDGEQQRGLLVRDPLGIKPLFYRKQEKALVFGSEAKAILAQSPCAAALDEKALHLLLNYRYLPGDHTLFADIRQLPPGQVFEWHGDGVNRVSVITGPEVMSGSISGLLEESVRAHLTADVEVAAYLSGGIDSAAVVAFARRHAPGLRTFSLAVGDDPNEAVNAMDTATRLGIPNTRLEVDADYTSLLPIVVRHLEVPKVNALQIALLAQATSQHVKVALSGLGGDELFLGYNLHRWLHRGDQWRHRVPAWLRRGAGQLGLRLTAIFSDVIWSERERAASLLQSIPDWPLAYSLLRNLWDSPSLRRHIYGPRLLDAQLPDAVEDLRSRWPADPDPVMAAARFEWREKMVNDLLWNEDRCGMAVGLEVRVPFVDTMLASAVRHLDRSTLMPGGRLKGYLRNCMAETLPLEVVNRPKSGFQLDAPRFFHRFLMPLAEDYLSEAAVRKHGLFNPHFVAKTMALPTSIHYRWHFFILMLMLGTHVWMDQFEGAVPGKVK